MLRNRWSYVLLAGMMLLAFVVLTGCSDSSASNPFAGSYVGTIDEDGNGPNFTATVDANGIVTFTIFTDGSDTLIASGTVNNAGELQASCLLNPKRQFGSTRYVNPLTLIFTAQVSGDTFTGNWAFESEGNGGTFDAVKVANTGSPWAGEYHSDIAGTLNATFIATVDASGVVTATVQTDSETYPATGTIDPSGRITFSGPVDIPNIGNVTLTCEGRSYVSGGKIELDGDCETPSSGLIGHWSTKMLPE